MSEIDRRSFLRSAPVVGFAAMVANTGAVHAAPADPALLALIEELESIPGYEPSAMAVGRQYAAYRLRLTLGLEIPEPTRKGAEMYVADQHRGYQTYLGSLWHERDLAAGTVERRPFASLGA